MRFNAKAYAELYPRQKEKESTEVESAIETFKPSGTVTEDTNVEESEGESEGVNDGSDDTGESVC